MSKSISINLDEAPEPELSRADLLAALQGGTSALGPDQRAKVLDTIDSLYAIHERQEALTLEVRRQRHNYTTILETIREISLKALDIPRFEQYVTNTIRGQFGVLKVLFIRQSQHLDDTLAVHTARMVNPPTISVPLSSDFATFLNEHAGPVLLDPLPPPLAGDAYAADLVNNGVVLAVPLVKKDETGDMALKGILGLGPRIGKLPYSDKDLEFLGLLGSMVGISLHNAHLYHRSIVDGLTQVYSRGHFDIHLEQELDRVRRYNAQVLAEGRGTTTGVTLVLLDIDFFKKFNDRYGHQIGDLVLFEVARTLQTAVRAMDVVCRYGGEEFGIIFPDATIDVAVPIAERMRATVEARKIETEKFGPLSVTISLGVATYPQDADDVRSLVASSDASLYRAKDLGRNRVIAAAHQIDEAAQSLEPSTTG